jgi:predicted DNA-binding transcriptional regulator AlpA
MRVISFAQLKPEKGVPFTRRWLARMIGEGTFPKPVRLSARRIAWREEDVDRWIEQREVITSSNAKG